MSEFGAELLGGRARFAVYSRSAEALSLCLFDKSGVETRIAMTRGDDSVWRAEVPDVKENALYGFRAAGAYEPSAGLWFDASKLLMDPCGDEIDRQREYDPRLGAFGVDTAQLSPKALLKKPFADVHSHAPLFAPGTLIYEMQVKAFTINHPAVEPEKRGTIAALADPAILAHLKKLGVGAIEVMPVTAWIDERHLPPLGLRNAWGYNPVTLCALDPRLAPGGVGELRRAVAALHHEGIAVFLDLVFNHTGESDDKGPTLSLRGLDNETWYRLDHGRYVNDTGCGNTLDCANPIVVSHIIHAMRHFVRATGVDGFRLDLALTLGRVDGEYSPRAPLFSAIAADPVLADRIFIGEPWDLGPDGYRLGGLPPNFLEWNDKFRDGVRRFWRGDGSVADLATRLAGSSDCFEHGGAEKTRSVNYLAAHDGFTLADVVAYAEKHNEANGENNCDGHDENFSWNCGAEGVTENEEVLTRRRRCQRALFLALFISRGMIMVTAGDEFGRTQRGNNNAYAQDNATTWLDWENRDRDLEDFVASLSRVRREFEFLRDLEFLDPVGGANGVHVEWRDADGVPMTEERWRDAGTHVLTMAFAADEIELLRVSFDRERAEAVILEAGA